MGKRRGKGRKGKEWDGKGRQKRGVKGHTCSFCPPLVQNPGSVPVRNNHIYIPVDLIGKFYTIVVIITRKPSSRVHTSAKTNKHLRFANAIITSHSAVTYFRRHSLGGAYIIKEIQSP